MPGYIVDVGRPARLKLTELGPRVRPLILEKLESHNYAERICAIQVLGSVGESPGRVAQLLTHELKRATLRRHEIGALKCATTLPTPEPTVGHLSLLALGSKHSRTRRLAADYLLQLRNHPSAPDDLARRLLALLDDTDVKTRLLVASRLAKEGAPRSYKTLLDGVNSTNRETVLLAAYYVAQLRNRPHVVPWKATKREVDKALEEHRKWLEKKLKSAHRP